MEKIVRMHYRGVHPIVNVSNGDAVLILPKWTTVHFRNSGNGVEIRATMLGYPLIGAVVIVVGLVAIGTWATAMLFENRSLSVSIMTLLIWIGMSMIQHARIVCIVGHEVRKILVGHVKRKAEVQNTEDAATNSNGDAKGDSA